MMRPALIVDSRLRVSGEATRILGEPVIEELRRLCTHDNPALAAWHKHKKGYPPAAVLSGAEREGAGWSFPRSLVPRAIDLAGGRLPTVDRRVFAEASVVPWLGHPARPYQRRLIDFGLECARRRSWCAGVWRAPTGSGKTDLLLELVGSLGLRALVVVPRASIYTQWLERVRGFLGVEPGEIQGSTLRVGELVTVGMQQTLVKRAGEVAQEFGAVILDEAQLCASKTYREVVDALPAGFRVAVSDDERRADGLEFVVHDLLGPVTNRVTPEEVKAVGGIVDVEVVLVPTEFEAGWYKALPPDLKFTKRSELLDAVGADSRRLELAASLARRCRETEGEQVAILAGRREHCERLDALLCATAPSVLLLGGDGRVFKRNRELFASGRAPFAVGTYQAIGVGFESHRGLARGVLAGPVAANAQGEMQFKQYLGRFARSAEGKLRGVVFYLLDERVFGRRPARLIRDWVGANRVSVLVGERRVPVEEWLKTKEPRDETSNRKVAADGTIDFGFE